MSYAMKSRIGTAPSSASRTPYQRNPSSAGLKPTCPSNANTAATSSAAATVAGIQPANDDIGRYGWSAAFAALSGDEAVVALRVSVALFQWLGLAVALAWLARAVPSRGAWLLGALALLAWMFPSHKVYDIVVCLLLIAATAAVIDAPSIRRYLAAGVVLGLAAVMGRNHGVYGAVAMLGAVAWNRAAGAGPGPWAALGAGSAGVVAGYAPMLLLLAFDGGFRVAFVDDLRMMFEAGSTNLPLPVPWPHLAFSGAGTGFALLREVLVGLMFVALPAFVVAGAALASRSGAARLRAAPLCVACLLLAVLTPVLLELLGI